MKNVNTIMSIDALITELMAIKEIHGDINVVDANGNFMYANSALYVATCHDTCEVEVHISCESQMA